MGTTLTGTTPQDTYDSLIKVTDNGPLTGSLKKLTDGLGNDSSLSLSTAAASFSGTLAVAGNATFDTSTLFVDAANNRVGIGTTSPSTKLQVAGDNGIPIAYLYNNSGAAGQVNGLNVEAGTNSSDYALSVASSLGTSYLRVRGDGNVGIGTSSPSAKLTVVGANANSYLAIDNAGAGENYIAANSVNIFQVAGAERARITTDGLTFNGDTAAANALDDYEEGTWTMGVSFGGASVGVTYANNTGTYTKIGRQVTVNGYLSLTNKGSSTGSAKITGLPFTIANGNGFYSTAAVQLVTVTFTNQYSAIAAINTTTIELYENTLLGAITDLTDADFANTSNSVVSLTYFV
jgi:hypothetical protein